jgi:hypothetical protein
LLHSPSHTLHSDLIRFCSTYIVSTRTHRKYIRCPAMDICEPHRKHFFLYCIYSALHSNGSYPIVACVLRALPSNRYPIAPRVCFCGNVFSDPLPSNGQGAVHIRVHNASCNTFSIVACAYFVRCLQMGLHVTILLEIKLMHGNTCERFAHAIKPAFIVFPIYETSPLPLSHKIVLRQG